MTADAGRPRRLRGREAKEFEARSAQDTAVQAFYRMDLAQRDVGVQVEAYANIGADPAATARLRAEYTQLSVDADARAQRYLATLDANPIEDTTTLPALYAAVNAFRAAAADIDAMAGALESFAERNGGLFGQVGAALERVAGRTAAANAALAEARTSVAALAEAGIKAGAAGAALAEAEAAAAELTRGVAAHGVPGAVALAERVCAAAARAHALAADLPRRKAEVTRRLGSIRTRREALANQATAVPDLLHGLRRAYVESCWADIVDVPERVADALGAADTEVARAAQAARDAEWDAAAAALARAVAHLDTAAELVGAAKSRPAALEEARRDPAGRVSAARFTVRDAQKLVMAGRSLPPAPWAGQLDALSARLDGAEAMLGGVHPDYWAFLTELRRVTDATADLVQRFRAHPNP